MFLFRTGLLIGMALAPLLLGGCGKGGEARREGMASPGGGTAYPARRLLRCASPVDGMPLEASVAFPPGYDNAHRRPLILVLPGAAFPEETPLGEAMVARLSDPRPAGECPLGVRLEDWGRALEYLTDNLPAERQRIFAVGQGRAGVAFVCRHALELAGAVLSFPPGEEREFTLEEFPVSHLENLPLWVELPASGASPGGRALKAFLASRPEARFNAPARLLGGAEGMAPLLEAFSWLSAQPPQDHHRLVWEWRMGEPFPPGWLMAERRGPEPQALLEARRSREEGRTRLEVKTRGIRRLALQSDAPEFRRGEPILVHLDEAKLGVSPQQGWVKLEQGKPGEWTTAGVQPTMPQTPENEWTTLQSFLARPVLLVVGTAFPERTALWEEAAQDFSQEWKRRTGMPIPVRRDDSLTAADMRERRLILLGGGEENLGADALLASDRSFLRRLFQTLPPQEQTHEKTFALTLCPAELLAPGTMAALVVVNDPQEMKYALRQFLSPQAEKNQFLLASPAQIRLGRFSPEGKILPTDPEEARGDGPGTTPSAP